MIRIGEELPGDAPAREALLDAAFGGARLAKTSERLREGRLPAGGLALAAKDGARLVGTLRFWHVAAGRGRQALMLGPLAVDSAFRDRGIGGTLIRYGLAEAEARGHGAVLLVGDAPYYTRFGFDAALTGGLWLPGHYAPERFLGLELRAGALAGARGLVMAAGERAPTPAWLAAEAALFGAREGGWHRRAA